MAKAKLFLTVGLLASLLFVPTQAIAANKPKASPRGISISPFERQLTVAQTDAAQSFDLKLTNHTSNLQEIKLLARDFGSLNETGGVLLEGSKSYNQKYGLASWISLGTDTVLLPPGESRSIPITIDNRSSLRPGGHYGAVVARVASLADQKDNRVAINQELLSLIFVTKLGGEKYDLKLSAITPNGNWFHLPSTVKLRFQNPGNVHVVPRGVVTLKSPTGTVIATGIINSESAYILPEAFRELYVPLTKLESAIPFPGLYKVEVAYRYDGINQVAVKRYNLQFINLGLYMILALVGLTLIFGFRRHKRLAKKT